MVNHRYVFQMENNVRLSQIISSNFHSLIRSYARSQNCPTFVTAVLWSEYATARSYADNVQ